MAAPSGSAGTQPLLVSVTGCHLTPLESGTTRRWRKASTRTTVLVGDCRAPSSSVFKDVPATEVDSMCTSEEQGLPEIPFGFYLGK